MELNLESILAGSQAWASNISSQAQAHLKPLLRLGFGQAWMGSALQAQGLKPGLAHHYYLRCLMWLAQVKYKFIWSSMKYNFIYMTFKYIFLTIVPYNTIRQLFAAITIPLWAWILGLHCCYSTVNTCILYGHCCIWYGGEPYMGWILKPLQL